MTQARAIDISSWQVDDSFGLAYPEGARPKRLTLSPAISPDAVLKPDWRYLFKLSDKRYPEQFWAEVVAHEIGNLLGIPVPPAFAAFDAKSGQCGALIEWFYVEGETTFLAAGDLFQRIVPGFDREHGSQHNLVDALRFARLAGGSAGLLFHEALLFDTLIGNTDRHQDNWGFLLTSQSRQELVGPRRHIRFAPWFDNGTSLGHERDLNLVGNWSEEQYERYMRKGKHHLRPSRHEKQRIEQLSYMRALSQDASPASGHLAAKLQAFRLDALEAVLGALTTLDMPEAGRLSEARAQFMLSLTRRRYTLLMEFFS